MTVEFPAWYMVATVFFMAATTLAFFGLAFVAWKIAKALERVEPQVEKLMEQMNSDVLPQVKSVMTKVDSLTETVNGMATTVSGITSSAKSSVDLIGGGAGRVTDALAHFLVHGIQKFEKAAPAAGLLLTAIKLYREFSGSKPVRKRASSVPVSAPEPTNGTLPSSVTKPPAKK